MPKEAFKGSRKVPWLLLVLRRRQSQRDSPKRKWIDRLILVKYWREIRILKYFWLIACCSAKVYIKWDKFKI